MPVCPSCQTHVPDTARFCHNCGSRILSRLTRTRNHKGPSGIGGWLILVVIVLIGSMIGNFITGLDYFIEELSFETIIYLLLVVYSITCLICLMRCSRFFPLLFTIYACTSTIAGLFVRTPVLILSGQWISLSLLLTSVLFTILWIIYMRRSKRVKNTFKAAAPSQGPAVSIDSPSGLGGWMIFVILVLFSNTLAALFYGVQYLIGGTLIPALLLFGVFSYCIVCMVFMFRYSRHFPKLFIGLLSILIIINFIISLLFYMMTKEAEGMYELIPMAFWSLVWIAYMLRSKRVKKTFVK